jgi:hypothetical protein
MDSGGMSKGKMFMVDKKRGAVWLLGVLDKWILVGAGVC